MRIGLRLPSAPARASTRAQAAVRPSRATLSTVARVTGVGRRRLGATTAARSAPPSATRAALSSFFGGGSGGGGGGELPGAVVGEGERWIDDEDARQRTQKILERCAALHATLQPMNERLLGPLERNSDDTTMLPFVLLLGNHSSGKSSFINHVLGRRVQTAGVAPTDDSFTIVAPGPADIDQVLRLLALPLLLLSSARGQGGGRGSCAASYSHWVVATRAKPVCPQTQRTADNGRLRNTQNTPTT